jgi:hypothetical protein
VTGPDPADPDSRLTRALRTIDQLQEAIESRTVIGQATGILMALHRIDAERAWAAMTRVSMDTNVRIRELADAVVAIVTSEEPVDDSPAATAAVRHLLPGPESHPFTPPLRSPGT